MWPNNTILLPERPETSKNFHKKNGVLIFWIKLYPLCWSNLLCRTHSNEGLQSKTSVFYFSQWRQTYLSFLRVLPPSGVGGEGKLKLGWNFINKTLHENMVKDDKNRSFHVLYWQRNNRYDVLLVRRHWATR